MPLSLTDVRRRVTSEAGQRLVRPYWIGPRSLRREIAAAIALYEAHLGESRAEFEPLPELEALFGDYRVARGIASALGASYQFRAPDLDALLSDASRRALARRGLASPEALRLWTYDRVNARQRGFVTQQTRGAVLEQAAGELGVSPSEYEALLTSDADDAARLERAPGQSGPPELAAVAQRFNREVVEALLAHARAIHLRLLAPSGALIKAAYFRAKGLGLVADAELEPNGAFALHMGGPDELVGPQGGYGVRLARFARWLRRRPDASWQGEALIALPNGEALLRLDAVLFGLLASDDEADSPSPFRGGGQGVGSVNEDEAIYDSLVESEAARQFSSLAGRGQTHGWALEREPDPIPVPGSVFIPDFALRRGETRVYCEVIGFWTADYRARKRAKLEALAGQIPLLLAISADLRADFEGLPFPTVWYKGRVPLPWLLETLDREFGAVGERVAAAQGPLVAVAEAARTAGWLPETTLFERLGVYRRSELGRVLAGLDASDLRALPGVGLVSEPWLEAQTAALKARVAAEGGRLPLETALATLRAAGLGDAADTLLDALPGLRVERESLFDAFVVAE